MARIKNPDKYIRKFREDFEIVKRKFVINSYLLSEEERNNVIDCLTQLQNIMEDEIRGIIKEKEKITGQEKNKVQHYTPYFWATRFEQPFFDIMKIIEKIIFCDRIK